MELQTFYVTFGMGGILRGYHAIFQAYSRDILHKYLNIHCRGLWSDSKDKEPTNSKRLRDTPEVLYYSHEDHINA